MNLFVDTSIWSLALRRDIPPKIPALAFLRRALEGNAAVRPPGPRRRRALHTECRRKGLLVGTIDVLLAKLCLRHHLTMLTTDPDFTRIGEVAKLTIWRG